MAIELPAGWTTSETECVICLPIPSDLPVVCCYDSNSFGDLSTNNAGMLAHVAEDGSFWHTASETSGFGSGPYPIATPTQSWYLLEPVEPGGPSCALQEVTAVSLGAYTANFQSTQTPQGGTCGKSDEKCYKLALSSISPTILGNPAAQTFFGENTGVSFLFSTANKSFGSNTWCKFDGFFYSMLYGLFGSDKEFGGWPIPSPAGTFETLNVPMQTMLPGWVDATFNGESAIKMIHGFEGHLYILAVGPWSGGVSHYRIYKVLASNLTYVSHWDLTGDANFAAPWGLHVWREDLFFLIKDTSPQPWSIGTFIPGVGSAFTTEILDTIPATCTAAGNAAGTPGQHGFFFAGDYFYLSYSGFGLGVTNVLKVGPIVCVP